MNPTSAHSASASSNTIWAFDLGKGSIGEAVRQGDKFPHKESLLIPADFADTKPAASRRRMMRTRQAHKQRERWLDSVWAAAGLEVLRGRQVQRDEKTRQWTPPIPGDQKLEREFAAPGDATCYTSSLLRIKLLRGEKLEPWQIFKALRSSIQKRGYGKIPWAAKEARRAGKSEEDLEKDEEKADAQYAEALNKWGDFKKQQVSADCHFPCYYDAWKMGLWNPSSPATLHLRPTHAASSTRNVRFDRDDVEREIKQLANNAAKQLPAVAEIFAKIQRDGWLRPGSKKRFPVTAKSFGDFLCYGLPSQFDCAWSAPATRRPSFAPLPL